MTSSAGDSGLIRRRTAEVLHRIAHRGEGGLARRDGALGLGEAHPALAAIVLDQGAGL
jgi:hypothetical protein